MKSFVKAALVRAVRTLCQAAIAGIGTAAVIGEVNWAQVLSASALAAILSILTSIATGLPEAQEKTREVEDVGDLMADVLMGECAREMKKEDEEDDL